MAEQSGVAEAPPAFLANACVKQAQLPICNPQQPERQPHKKKARGKKRKRTRRALRLSLQPQVHAMLPVLARLMDGHSDPHLVAQAAQSHFGAISSNDCIEIDWDALPTELNPRAGNVPPARAERKRRQIESMLYWGCCLLPPVPVAANVRSRPVVVDFCAGGGHLGLVLAALRPDIKVVLLDVKQPALARAQKRATAMGLTNVQIFCGTVGEYRAPFDLALALHSCGGAADAVQAAALAAGAGFVIAPCCYGFIQAAAEECAKQGSTDVDGNSAGLPAASTDAKLLLVADLEYPRSAAYRGIHELSTTVYAAIAGSADATYWPTDARAGEHDKLARDCMNAIDRDRTLLATEVGYNAAFTSMNLVATMSKDANKRDDLAVGGSQKRSSGARPSAFQGGKNGAGLKNQVLIGWRPPTRHTT